MHTESKGNGFFNGFVLGLLVGAGIVFLFGTQKGRRVLELLLEQVEESTELSDLLEIPEDEEYEDMIEEEPEDELNDFSSKNDEKEEVIAPKEEKKHTEKPSHSPVAKTTARVKRFFKGSPKRVIS